MNYEILLYVTVFAASTALSATLMKAMLRTWWSTAIVDHPNERSLHDHPIPRIGGIAVHAAAAIVAAAGCVLARIPIGIPTLLAAILAAAAALFVFSLVDDRRSLSVRSRLFAQLACAGIVSFLALPPLPWAAGLAIGLCIMLAIVWMTNLYNFMDGANGLASGMSVIGFGAYAWLAARHTDAALALVALALAGASLGFLRYNFGTARAFLGDSGSIPLGFFAGALGLYGWSVDVWRWWTPVAVFLPFVADASLTLLQRAVRGEKLWKAHREHAYQRLVLMGWSHSRVASWAYALMIVCAACAVALQDREATLQWLGIAGLALPVAAGWLFIERSVRP